MNKNYRFCILLFSLALSSCIFVPERKPETRYDPTCDLSMPKWGLTVADIENFNACSGANNGEAEACLVAMGIVIPVGSFVVSGSIVVTGNTLRWLEYQGKCDDSVINRALAQLKRQIGK